MRGKFVPADPAHYAMTLAAMDGPVTVILKRFHDTRTNRQNRAWFGIVVPIFQKCYNERSKEVAHYTLLKQIHYDIVTDIKGRIHRQVKPTHNLQTDEFSELYAKAQQFMAEEYGVDVPDPDPEFKKKAEA